LPLKRQCFYLVLNLSDFLVSILKDK
jgi:hypothetical protein